MSHPKEQKILLKPSLQNFFYERLQEINQQFNSPIPGEFLIYSSKVMEELGNSDKYFEIVEGRVREKILGKRLLESANLPKASQKRALRDIGDTSLLLCGYFSESLNRKVIGENYYFNIGSIAYKKLNTLVPAVYKVPSFYGLLSSSFSKVTTLMKILSDQGASDADQSIIHILGEKIIKVS